MKMHPEQQHEFKFKIYHYDVIVHLFRIRAAVQMDFFMPEFLLTVEEIFSTHQNVA